MRVKVGDVLFTREWDMWSKEYKWNFDTVKKITPKGKIRLEKSNELIEESDIADDNDDRFYGFRVYSDKYEKLYIEDEIKSSIAKLIVESECYISKLKERDTHLYDLIKLGIAFSNLKLEDIELSKYEGNWKSDYYPKTVKRFNDLLDRYFCESTENKKINK